jgi:hypothetical protein
VEHSIVAKVDGYVVDATPFAGKEQEIAGME